MHEIFPRVVFSHSVGVLGWLLSSLRYGTHLPLPRVGSGRVGSVLWFQLREGSRVGASLRMLSCCLVKGWRGARHLPSRSSCSFASCAMEAKSAVALLTELAGNEGPSSHKMGITWTCNTRAGY